MNNSIFSLLMILCFNLYSPAYSHCFDDLDGLENDQYLHALASLVFYTQEWEKGLKTPQLTENVWTFSDEEVASLWTKVYNGLCRFPSSTEQSLRESYLKLAYSHCEDTQQWMHAEQFEKAKETLNSASLLLRHLWEEAIELEEKVEDYSLFLRKKKEQHFKDPNLDDNPYIPQDVKKKIKPYHLPPQHPMREFLDSLCVNKRITLNKKTFHKAGFRTIDKRPRSYIRVAKHSKMPGYLVKVYLDTVLNEKRHKPSWYWLVNRCQGALKVSAVIRKHRIKHFVVPDKWIYCFPAEPSPPEDPQYTRHFALLLATDMNLAPSKQNYKAWYSFITTDHLDELYVIISRAKGSSYRPDNIAFTKDKLFAFIDTEYPSAGPDYKGIREYLNPEMAQYWDKLVKHGGL